MRHPIELAVQHVLPLESKPEATARDAATISKPFALLLSEAEAVHDHVRLSLALQRRLGTVPAAQTGPLHALSLHSMKDAWHQLCARLPWGGVVGLQAGQSALSAGERAKRKAV